MLDTIYIVRHGFRLDWTTTVWKSKTGLPRDTSLDAFGVIQAKELADHFLSLPHGQRPTAIFSSPYYRCLETAEPTALALNIPTYVEHGLSEWYSPVVPGTGLHPRPGPATSLTQHFPQIDPAWTSIHYPSRKGEDVPALHARMTSFFSDFVPELERRPYASPHTRILILTHAANVAVLVQELLGGKELNVRFGCCSLTELHKKAGAQELLGGWEARKLADCAHLSEGSLREWGLQDIEIVNGVVIEHPGEPVSEGEEDQPMGSHLHGHSNL